MQAGARTPEELETLLEDAFVMHDRDAIGGLFEHEALLSGGDRALMARGRLQIVDVAAAMWARQELYLAAPLRVLQTPASR